MKLVEEEVISLCLTLNRSKPEFICSYHNEKVSFRQRYFVVIFNNVELLGFHLLATNTVD